jgi:hypothetical protein
MSGSRKYSISLPEDIAEALEQRTAMDKLREMDTLREIVADFETDDGGAGPP